MNEKPDCVFKIILIGETKVGKTTLTERFKSNAFKEKVKVTCVSDFVKKEIEIRGKRVKLDIYDTSGQETYRHLLIPGYFKDVDGALLVYDVTDVKTFDEVHIWLHKVKQHAVGSVTLIVGNKIDHLDGISVSRKQVENLSTNEGLEFIEASAKSGVNVNLAFEYLTWKILVKKGLLPNDGSYFIPSTSSTNQASLTTSELPHLVPNIQIRNESPHGQMTGTRNADTDIDRRDDRSDEGIVMDEDEDRMSEESFIKVTFLPPIIPLDEDFDDLCLNRRRKMSSDSVSSLVTELPEFQQAVREHNEACAEADRKATKPDPELIYDSCTIL